ncbi:MAG: helix-turn-helix domain-containing protein [Kiritimatiellia bacterium]|jgi:AraC-like DNA-binding protein
MIEGEPIHETKLAGLRRYASPRGWDVEGFNQRDSRPAKIPGLLETHQPVGCIVECSGDRVILSPERFGKAPIIYLNCSRNPYGERIPMIATDNEAVARVAFRELSANLPSAYAVVGFAEIRTWSRSLFELRFREAMGRSILAEIQHVRLERVEMLLTRTDMPIGAIASFCGYQSDIALRKFFRSRTGMSMREWRKRNKG